MANYKVEVKPSAAKELDALDDRVFRRVDRKIVTLSDEPRPTGSKKLRGYKDYWRIRIGDWRVIYIVDDAKQLVTITRIAHRREVYD